MTEDFCKKAVRRCIRILSKEQVKRLDCPSWQIWNSFKIPWREGKNEGEAATAEVPLQAHQEL